MMAWKTNSTCQFFPDHLLRPTRPDAESARLADHLRAREAGDLGCTCEGYDPAGIQRFMRLKLGQSQKHQFLKTALIRPYLTSQVLG